METVSFPTVKGNIQPEPVTNKVDGKTIYGTGPLGGANGISFAGGGGINGTQGIWLGSTQFSTAPFSVSLQGDVKATTLVLTGFVPTGGSAADVNANATTISGGKITANTITASQIAAATITGTQIAATTITATNLNVSTLSAITANIGTVTSGNINGLTITGGTLQTASSNQRVVITGATNDIKFFDSTGTASGTIHGQSGGMYLLANTVAIDNGSGTTFFSIAGTAGSLTWDGSSNTFTVSGTKSFDIEHPNGKDGLRLRYICPESPEVLVMCRGKGKIVLPQHFIDVSEPDTLQIVKSGFLWKKTWIATAIRKGYLGYVNEYEGKSAYDHPSNIPLNENPQ